MSGVAIIGALLAEYEPLTGLVPATSIKQGRLPDGTPLPAVLIRTVSSTEWQSLTRESAVPTVDRVSVTVRASSYREQKAVMKLFIPACAGRTGTIAGFSSVAVLTAGAGPDVDGPANSFEQSQDFRVSFDAPQ